MTRTTAKDRRRRDLEEDEDDVVDRDELEDDGDEEPQMEDGGSSGGVLAELKNVVSDAALTVLAPVAKKAATSAAKYAVKKGPEFIEDTVKPMLEDAGGPAGMLEKLKPGGGDDGGGDAGDGSGNGDFAEVAGIAGTTCLHCICSVLLAIQFFVLPRSRLSCPD